VLVAGAPELPDGTPCVQRTARLIDQGGVEQAIALKHVPIERCQPAVALLRSEVLRFRVVAFLFHHKPA